eukprot:CAMPEP_0195541908 /NCGR_PEP_ID=MMETSP0794_2-20130614/51330_1 /TAXON_ID=515487 /ORGANISM="Stephanopyxis turris, Strain CCMP 815" /LENGTH=418 /DNA_ID=CAMNT_0040676023 /DNA_START=60 /DNA_END=1317 /DNA_ORIENTATION=+
MTPSPQTNPVKPVGFTTKTSAKPALLIAGIISSASASGMIYSSSTMFPIGTTTISFDTHPAFLFPSWQLAKTGVSREQKGHTFTTRKMRGAEDIFPLMSPSFIDTEEKKWDVDVSSIGVPLYDGTFIPEPPFVQRMATKSLASKLNVHISIDVSTNNLHRPLIVGHRGALYMELENTLAGFQVSADIGCDAVELDVFLLKCGSLVVFHGGGTDENPGCLRDYCGVEGSILDFTADEARKLRFNPNYDGFACPKQNIADEDKAFIPSLEEVLAIVKSSGIKVKIELKGHGTAEPVLELVEKMGMVDQCHYSSFSHERIGRIRELRPDLNPDGTHRYKTGCLFVEPPENFLDVALGVGASEVHLKYDTCTKDRIDAIHAAGMDSMAWFRGPIGMKEDVTYKYFDVENENEVMYDVEQELE